MRYRSAYDRTLNSRPAHPKQHEQNAYQNTRTALAHLNTLVLCQLDRPQFQQLFRRESIHESATKSATGRTVGSTDMSALQSTYKSTLIVHSEATREYTHEHTRFDRHMWIYTNASNSSRTLCDACVGERRYHVQCNCIGNITHKLDMGSQQSDDDLQIQIYVILPFVIISETLLWT